MKQALETEKNEKQTWAKDTQFLAPRSNSCICKHRHTQPSNSRSSIQILIGRHAHKKMSNSNERDQKIKGLLIKGFSSLRVPEP